MTAADVFTRADPLFRAALSKCARTGTPLEITTRPIWADLLALAALTLFGLFVLTAAAVFSGGAW